MTFRDIEKEPLQAQIPPDLGVEIRVLTAQRRGRARSQSMVVTELLCIALNKDPHDYGIEPYIKDFLLGSELAAACS